MKTGRRLLFVLALLSLSGCSCTWFRRNPEHPCSKRTKKLLTFWPTLHGNAPRKPKTVIPKEKRKRYTLTKVLVDDVVLVSKSEDAYKGIIQAFTHEESKMGRIIVRSDPTKKAGLYFIVKLDCALSMIPAGSEFKVTFIGSDSPQEHVRTWIMPQVKHSLLYQNEIWLGMTDAASTGVVSKEAAEELQNAEAAKQGDWEQKKANPWDMQKKEDERKAGQLDEKAQRKVSNSLIAWKIEIFAPDGRLLAVKTSYAW